MIVLGIHAALKLYDHDPGATIVVNGSLVSVCEEERFNRIKTSRGCLPIYSIKNCLEQAMITMEQVDIIYATGLADNDNEKRLRAILLHFFGYAPPIHFISHQMAHLSSAFYASGFNESMVISYDGSGDSLSCALAVGADKKISVLEEYSSKNSLGNFYELITQFLGFEPSEGAYKVMGLAPYGMPGINLDEFIEITKTGYKYNNDACYNNEIGFSTIEVPFYSKFVTDRLGGPRSSYQDVDQRHMDIAYAAQEKLNKAVCALVSHLHDMTGLSSLCLAGGVALNCSANLHISNLPFIEKMFVQPAASDRGLSLGCALYGAAIVEKELVIGDIYKCGPAYSDDQIEAALKFSGYPFSKVSDPSSTAAALLAENKIIGWFQGRSEYGPRALGHRSILANPKSSDIKNMINMRIKFREEFRPFAPAVIEEAASKYFVMDKIVSSPYMTIAVEVQPGMDAEIPGVVHVNNTARVQTVNSNNDMYFYQLISQFGKLTGTPVVLNTSFNIKGQPIVETPMDAIGTFAACGMDAMLIQNYLVTKNA